MKIVRCRSCKFEREVKDEVKIAICPGCLEDMKEVEDGRKKE